MELTFISGGITSPRGFRASGIHCGLRKNKSKSDLACIAADKVCTSAAVFTTNKVFAAPVGVTRAHLANGTAQAVICNSGNANTCNNDGYDKANATCRALAKELNIDENDIIVASTGVIGVPLPIEPILSGIPNLVSELSYTSDASESAAIAIMTTDTKKKEYAVEYTFDGKIIRLGGICKGSGMIEPNMATMLGFITTDANISAQMLDTALHAIIADTFNMISVDGDTSTNDMVAVMASGMSDSALIDCENEAFCAFSAAMRELCLHMCRAIAADGEGATRLIECNITNFSSVAGAKKLAKSVIKSPLVKSMIFGADANCGRILCALGYSGAEINPDVIDVFMRSKAGTIQVCENGCGMRFDEDFAKEVLTKNYIYIDVDMKCGECAATAWGCDLSYEYVRINGDYRS